MNVFYRILSPLFTVVFCLLLAQTPFFPWLADVSLDILFAVRGPKSTSQSIVIVGIDEPSLKELGPWPFPRNVHARLLENLYTARSIGFDLIFDHEDSQDKVFLEAITASPPVSLAVANNYQGELLFPSAILSNHVRLGHIETLLGKDGVVRRVELKKWDLPVISQTMLHPAGADTLSNAIDKPPQIINFYGPEFTFLYISYLDVLKGNIDPDFFRDRLVMIGSQALALGDVHITPFSRQHPIPGVEVQATILNNLLEDSFITTYRSMSYLLAGLGLALGIFVWPKGRELRNTLYGVCAIVIVMAVSIGSFELNYFINPSLPIVLLLVAYFSHLISQWLWLTAKLVKEIQRLDRKLDEGVEKVFTTVPVSLRRTTASQSPNSKAGISKQLENIHSGIETLAIQNRFINHLLSDETPPLALWQKQTGELVLANNGFFRLWHAFSQDMGSAPLLVDFHNALISLAVEGQQTALRKIINKEEQDFDLMVDILMHYRGKKTYQRAVVHGVKSSILGFTGVLASFTDVTEIRELERMKGDVMSIVSHELKLPLTTILGYGEMLSDSLEGREGEYAAEICNQSNRLAKMIEDFLDIARIESGKYVINKYPFDFLTVIHDAASGVTHSAQSKAIEIAYTLPAKTTSLMGDESLITQVILNLLDNAIKFSPENSVVQVEVIETEGTIDLQVKDMGPGIVETEKELIFEKFVRGTELSSAGGFGLGLSFVKEVITGHDGDIYVENRKGGGARFTVILPKP